jgi:hypothetical protein
MNNVNYARYMLVYITDLEKMQKTHPELYQNFRKSGFGIKRTPKPFSKIPIDLTLEQTINAESASRSLGRLIF